MNISIYKIFLVVLRKEGSVGMRRRRHARGISWRFFGKWGVRRLDSMYLRFERVL